MEYINTLTTFVSEFVNTTLKNTLVTTCVTTFLNLDILRSLFLIDGLICASIFLKEFLLLKFSEKRTNLNSKFILDYQKNIITKYNSIYTLDTFDRFIFYITIYTFSCILGELELDMNYNFLIFLVIPYIQNHFILLLPYSSYLRNKEIFIKYSLSKLSIQFIQNLHKDITPISNYHIFIIYNILNVTFVWNFIKNFLLVTLFYFLKSHQDYYYYYKAIKVSYFYNSGYNFTTTNLYEAIDLINLIIKEKRWNEFNKMEVINTFYILITNKYINENSEFFVTTSIELFKFFSVWTIISLLKLLFYLDNIYINTVILFLVTPFSKHKIKKIFTITIFYNLLVFNVNDIIITIFLITNNLFYLLLEELYFFIKNIYSIKKVLKVNKNKQIEYDFEIVQCFSKI
jgi:hypothetical protein